VKNEELPMSNVLQFYRMTYKTYDMQEYISLCGEDFPNIDTFNILKVFC